LVGLGGFKRGVRRKSISGGIAGDSKRRKEGKRKEEGVVVVGGSRRAARHRPTLHRSAERWTVAVTPYKPGPEITMAHN
jgi:hypothetical protein